MGLLIASILIPLNLVFATNNPKPTDDNNSKTVVITENETDLTAENNVEKQHPLEPLLKAIIHVESKGNPKAYNKNGDCVGLLQITPICVRECNNILKSQKKTKRYTYADRWDAKKSIEMFYILQEKHNPSYDLNKGIRLWNKSPKYKAKIMKALKLQK